jgi:hypothetical protein
VDTMIIGGTTTRGDNLDKKLDPVFFPFLTNAVTCGSIRKRTPDRLSSEVNVPIRRKNGARPCIHEDGTVPSTTVRTKEVHGSASVLGL